MNSLFSNSRFYILVFSFLLSIVIYFWARSVIPAGNLQIIRAQQIYALVSFGYLYLAVLASPVTKLFKSFPWRGQYIHARRGIGVSAFYFAMLHSLLTFFGQLGGFAGLGFLNNSYLISLGLGLFGLVILSILAITSFDYIVDKFTFPKWKLLHRLVYFGSIAVLVHAFLLGTHFSDLFSLIPQIVFVLVSILLILEAIRLDRFVNNKFTNQPKFGISFVLVMVLLTSGLIYLYLPSGGSTSLGIHAAHIQLAQQVAQQQNSLSNFSNIPGLNGDRTKRYTASFFAPDRVLPNQDATFKFRIYDASNGDQINYFLKAYAYPMHLIIVDSTLNYFEHIHPDEQGNGDFTITTQFPKAGLYHLYIQFQPAGGIEQQIGFSLPVGLNSGDQVEFASQPVDQKLTKVFENYEVSLDTHGELNSKDMTIGQDKLTFIIKDAKTKQPITNLKPFMAAFGHLSMINEKTYEFLHVHPNNLVAPPPDSNGGPNVDFLPIGIYGPIKPGIYRLFGEFSTKIGEDFGTNFTVEVK